MRRILLSCATLAVLMLPAAASAGARGHAGFLVVQRASGDGAVHGRPVVTLVVQGFVLGRVPQGAEARVDIYHLPSVTRRARLRRPASTSDTTPSGGAANRESSTGAAASASGRSTAHIA